VAGDCVAVEFKLETSAAVVAEVVLGKEHGYFYRDRDRPAKPSVERVSVAVL
jgi:hypothetical protein